MFIFDGGVLAAGQIASLKLLDGELAAFAFCGDEEAAKRLRPYTWQRVKAALEGLRSGRAVYLQDGLKV